MKKENFLEIFPQHGMETGKLTIGEWKYLADVFPNLKSNIVIRTKQQWMQWHKTMQNNIDQLLS